MLINAQRAEQLRVAIVEDSILKDYQVEITDRDLCRGNIYRGVVANVQPSLGAAFIDIGEDRHGFLPVGDVVADAYHKKYSDKGRPRIEQVLDRGKTVLVQVTKDGSGQKGPALTTNLALAGRYLVLTPFDSVRGISRKAEDVDARKKIRERLRKLNLPEEYGVIVRTNGLDQNQTTLNRDLNALLRLWKQLREEANKGKGPRLLYSDQDLVVQALRDYLDSSIGEVVVDNDEVYEKAGEYMQAFMPRSKPKLTRYQDRLPLFSRHRIETQIDRVYERTAPLPGGGYLVIDATEALTAIDVNSGRATRNADHDESILQVNVEAAAEVARQLRLRDIGGLVVVDFIDMRLRKHQRKIEKAMRDGMKDDRARYSVGRISPNGLLEINRQRIKQALRLRTHRPCPTCSGVGTIGTPEFAALKYLRRIEARAAGGNVASVTLALHPEIADALQNLHRQRLAAIEHDFDFRIEVLAAPGLKRAEERIEWKERDGEPAPGPKISPALSATDLAPPGDRGGRRKPSRKSRKSDDQDERKADAQSDDKDDQKAAEAQDDDQDGGGRRKRRRRRRGGSGRKPKSSEPKEAQAKEAKPKAKAQEATSKGAKSKDDGAKQEARAKDEPKKDEQKKDEPKRRSRRGRTRTTRSKADDQKADSPKTDEKKAAGKKAAEKKADERKADADRSRDEQKAGDERSRRRRRTSREGQNEEEKPRRGRTRRTTSSRGDEAPAEGDAAAPRRGRTRRTTSSRGDEAPAEGDAAAPRRGRTRRRTRSADNGDERKASEKKADERKTDERKASEKKADKRNTEGGKPDRAIPEPPAGSGPSDRLRWQWWGGDTPKASPIVREGEKEG